MHVEWTANKQLVLETIKHPAIYNFVADDTCGDVDSFDIPDFNDVFFSAACYKGDKYMGCFCFLKKSDDEAEVHTCLLPIAKGMAVEFSKLMAGLIYRTKEYSKISTFVPEFNALARRLTEKVGFSYVGEGESFIVDGKAIKTNKYILNLGDICQ